MSKSVRDAVREARINLASIPIFAQALCGEKGVKVVISPGISTAMTDGTTIQLPALPMPKDASQLDVCEALLDLVRLFIPHEAGHIRYTSFGAMRDMPNDLARSLLNAIEDPRMELEMIQSLPGTRKQMDVGCERLASMGQFGPLEADSDPAELMTMYVLYVLRGHLREQEMMLDFAEQTRPAVVEVFGERFTNRLDILLATDGMSMQSTKHAAKLVRTILDVIDEEEKARDKEPKGGDSGDGNQSGSQGDSSGASKAGGTAQGDQSGGAAEGSGGQSGDGQDDGQGASGSSAGDGSDAGTGNGAGGGNPFTKAREDGSKGCRDLGAIVGEAIDQASNQAVSQGAFERVSDVVRSADIEDGSMSAAGRPLDPTDAQMTSRALKTRLRSLLQGLTMQRTHESVRGHRISQRKIHRTGQYDRRLFVHQDQQKGVETVVYLLGDTSGSMDGERINVTSKALYAVADAMHSLSKVKVGVGAFPDCRTVLPIGGNPRAALDRSWLRAGGSTPMGEAMYWAGRQLARRSEPRKILVVLTDGQPDDAMKVKAATLALEGMGVEVFGIGIQHQAVEQLFAQRCVVWNLEELPAEMLAMLRGALTTARKAAA